MVKSPAPKKNIHKVKKTKSRKRISPSKSPTQNLREKNKKANPLPKIPPPIHTQQTPHTPYIPKK